MTNTSFYDSAPAPQTDDLGAVIRWAAGEFETIREMLSTRELLPIYGGLQLRASEGPAADQPLGATPEILTPYDQVTPATDRSSGPEGVIGDVSAGTVQVDKNSEGIFLLGFFYTVSIVAGSEYRLEIFLNGNATGLISIVDSSNQTSMVNMATQALVAALDADTVDVRGTASGPVGDQSFIVEACQLYIAKVGGRLGGSLTT